MFDLFHKGILMEGIQYNGRTKTINTDGRLLVIDTNDHGENRLLDIMLDKEYLAKDIFIFLGDEVFNLDRLYFDNIVEPNECNHEKRGLIESLNYDYYVKCKCCNVIFRAFKFEGDEELSYIDRLDMAHQLKLITGIDRGLSKKELKSVVKDFNKLQKKI